MKKTLSLLFAFLLLFSFLMPVSAAGQEQVIYRDQQELENGITIISEIMEESLTRSSSKGYTYKKTIAQNDVTIAVISMHGEFSYNGTTVSVVSKSVTQTDTYEGWSYKQNSFTSSGGTITLDAKLTKLLVLNVPFTMTLSCDKNGNISYT